MRICLSAIAAVLLAQVVLGQETPQEDTAADVSQEAAAATPTAGAEVSNAEFQTLQEFDTTPVVSFLEVDQDFQILSWTSDNPISTKSFVFELDAPAHLLLTDFKQNGDSFMVYDNGELIGATRPAETTEAFAATPEDAVKDKTFSKAAFALAPGAHNITVEATSPFEFGSAAVRLLSNEQALFKDDDDDEEEDDDHHRYRHHHKRPQCKNSKRNSSKK
ncbi:hypothetical protein BGW37DRAFT_495994 [Umbelopsis sp. PMI_123]|nr:hypothetical protein BGW37DRAFT_495994 [Umbelopsis sp. PMI_123]